MDLGRCRSLRVPSRSLVRVRDPFHLPRPTGSLVREPGRRPDTGRGLVEVRLHAGLDRGRRWAIATSGARGLRRDPEALHPLLRNPPRRRAGLNGTVRRRADRSMGKNGDPGTSFAFLGEVRGSLKQPPGHAQQERPSGVTTSSSSSPSLASSAWSDTPWRSVTLDQRAGPRDGPRGAGSMRERGRTAAIAEGPRRPGSAERPRPSGYRSSCSGP